MKPTAGPSRENVHEMFDRIAGRYDMLNRLFSMRIDVLWRNKLAKRVPCREGLRVLDLATGTADVLATFARMRLPVTLGVGVDMSRGMLELGRTKLVKLGLEKNYALVRGDGMQLPLPDGTFDAVSISFGIRNFIDVPQGLREMRRVLRPGGRVLILEFSLPKHEPIRALYLFYLRHVLPAIGSLASCEPAAYRYLNQTIEIFPHGRAFCSLMEEAGFQQVSARPLTFGIATLYEGER